ncbi:MAG TPA: hypothetical protein EYQ74_10560 [Planctomycetes bacterium]|nr:hypothetical protein [Planctomycetota bacterium]HIK61226.1 hypothetical protein [Planctomycetota bacterium]
MWSHRVQDAQVSTEPDVHQTEGLALINLGVSGYGTDRELLLFNRIDNHFSPRGHREFARLFSDGAHAERCRNVHSR